MTHDEFVAAYREGKLAAHVDPKAAAQLVSSRMMLPLILLPVLGLGVALALVGYLVAGALVFVAGLAFRYFVRATSGGFVLNRALENREFYAQALKEGLLSVEQRP